MPQVCRPRPNAPQDRHGGSQRPAHPVFQTIGTPARGVRRPVPAVREPADAAAFPGARGEAGTSRYARPGRQPTRASPPTLPGSVDCPGDRSVRWPARRRSGRPCWPRAGSAGRRREVGRVPPRSGTRRTSGVEPVNLETPACTSVEFRLIRANRRPAAHPCVRCQTPVSSSGDRSTPWTANRAPASVSVNARSELWTSSTSPLSRRRCSRRGGSNRVASTNRSCGG